MQRLNKSTHAPVGTAFFLFLSLAILPFSLRAAGVEVSLSPRLSAAMDAWQQIADVFGASYQLGTSADLSVVRDLDSDPASLVDGSVDSSRQFLCAREFQEDAGLLNDVSESCVRQAATAPRAPRKPAARFALPPKQVASIVVAGSGMKYRAVEALSALKLETDTREVLLKSIDKQLFRQSLAPIPEIRNLPISNSMRVHVRIKRPAAVSFGKTAECKVFSALASERRHEWERAVLTGMPSTSPDNSEF